MLTLRTDAALQAERPYRKQTEMLAQLSKSLDQCMSETRTISHLLHPPLIDELGLQAAAKWYIEAFSERSGIKARIELSNESQRLPQSVGFHCFAYFRLVLAMSTGTPAVLRWTFVSALALEEQSLR
jgi:signal transduction histidine kinase